MSVQVARLALLAASALASAVAFEVQNFSHSPSTFPVAAAMTVPFLLALIWHAGPARLPLALTCVLVIVVAAFDHASDPGWVHVGAAAAVLLTSRAFWSVMASRLQVTAAARVFDVVTVGALIATVYQFAGSSSAADLAGWGAAGVALIAASALASALPSRDRALLTFAPGMALISAACLTAPTFAASWPGWALGLALIAWGAGGDSLAFARRDHLLVGTAAAAAITAVSVLVIVDGGGWTRELAGLTALLALVRMLQMLVHRVSAVTSMHAQSHADALTGLGNRRALVEDMQRVAERAEPHVLTMFDLNNFKTYNDTFGHPAGDELLRRLGAQLAGAVDERATAYRLGGDEFCMLAPAAEQDEALTQALAALRAYEQGVSISASAGSASIGADASSVEQAMRQADQRMYQHKRSSRMAAAEQVRRALMEVTRLGCSELENHAADVGAMAFDLATSMGMDADACEDVRRAGDLHDVGKLAIDPAILAKPGPLDDREREIMRTHTLLGEQMLKAAPALRAAAGLVRASHERFDGAGYPDGLAGGAIPVGARIIAVVDAYSAMISPRPYHDAMRESEAIDELVRCSGSQFDPSVVDAFCQMMSTRQPIVA